MGPVDHSRRAFVGGFSSSRCGFIISACLSVSCQVTYFDEDPYNACLIVPVPYIMPVKGA